MNRVPLAMRETIAGCTCWRNVEECLLSPQALCAVQERWLNLRIWNGSSEYTINIWLEFLGTRVTQFFCGLHGLAWWPPATRMKHGLLLVESRGTYT